MRRVMSGIVILVLSVSSVILISGIFIKAQKKEQKSENIAKLPSFSLMTLNNRTFYSSEIRNGPVLVIRFHPECEHCQYEISEILKSKIIDSGAIIILVSSADSDSITRFLTQFNYADYQSVIPLVDTSNIFGDIFGSDIVPSIYIYNKELDLVKILHGETKPETIIKSLDGSE